MADIYFKKNTLESLIIADKCSNFWYDVKCLEIYFNDLSSSVLHKCKYSKYKLRQNTRVPTEKL